MLVKQAEQLLKDSEEKYRSLFENSMDGILITITDGDIIAANPAACIMFQMTEEEICKVGRFGLVDDTDALVGIAIKERQGLGRVQAETTLVRKNGTKFPAEITSSVYKLANGEERTFIIVRDVSERKKRGKDFESERQHLKKIFKQVPCSVGIFSGPDHVFEMANELYLQLTGRKNIVGKTVREVFPEVESQGLPELLDEVYRTGNSYTAKERLIKVDKAGNGTLEDVYLDFVYEAYRDNENHIEGVFFFAIDVTEQVQSRKKIEQSEKQYRQVVETAQEGIWLIDENDKTVFVNEKLCEIFGYTQKEMLRKDIYYFMDEEDRQKGEHLMELKRNGVKGQGHFKYRSKTGQIVWTNISANPIFEEGVYKGSLAMLSDITEKKQADAMLKESEQKYRLLSTELEQEGARLVEAQAVAKVGSWQTDIPSLKIIWSAETYRIFGTDPGSFSPTHPEFLKFIHPDDKEKVDNAFRRSFKNDEINTIDHRIITLEGEEKFVQENWKVTMDDQGKPLHATGTCQDITRSKKAEFQLLEQRSELQRINEQQVAILNALPPQIALLDNKGVIFKVNEAWKKFGRENGIENDDIWIGQNYVEVACNSTGEDKEPGRKIAEKIPEVISGKIKEFSLEYPCHSPTVDRWFKVVISPLMNLINEGAVVLHMDITERKIAEDKLKEKQEQLLESQRIAHVGSWQINIPNSKDIDSSIFYCSEETCRIYGFTVDECEFSYRLLTQFIHHHDRRQVLISFEKAIEERVNFGIDFRILTREGSDRWVHLEAKIKIHSTRDYPLKIFGTVKDISLQKEQELLLQKNADERELLIAELTRSIKDLRQFTYITSHNFRAPLSNLLALTGLIDYTTLTNENKEVVEMFKSSTLHLNNIINDLLQILLIRNNVNVDITKNNVRELLSEVMKLLIFDINETGCRINIDLEAEEIMFNSAYLESILLNLLSNAIKFRSPERALQIDISTTFNNDRTILLKVQDNGLGIDLNRHKSRMFGMYQRFHSNTNSTGLGLFIVRSQLTSLGGSIEVESEVNKGTCFYLNFK